MLLNLIYRAIIQVLLEYWRFLHKQWQIRLRAKVLSDVVSNIRLGIRHIRQCRKVLEQIRGDVVNEDEIHHVW